MVKYFKTAAILCCAAMAFPVSAQYAARNIPEEISKGSVAVVRHSEIVFEYVSPTLAKTRETLVITVLKSSGEGMGVFMEYTNKFSALTGFSGEIFDANGKSVRKIKQAELGFSDYSGMSLADDNRTHYCDPSVPPPPYTIRYEWETTVKNAVWSFPVFVPQSAMSVGVEKAVYRLECPAGMEFHAKAYNMEYKPEKISDPKGKKDIYTLTVENLPPLVREPYGRTAFELMPVVYFSPDRFIYDGIEGSMRNWEAYSEWQWKLLKDRSAVPPELKARVAELTKNASSDLEKVRILYDYLGETTRYVSIQIGIGGFQPMTVAEVYKNKYGDCKALTNYLHAMLAECGISSYYTEIKVNSRSIPRDFVHPSMSNHALLAVPMGADTLWVECTNPELPLGYRHNSIVGQNALVYKDGSAEIIEVPRYPDSLNLSVRRAEVMMDYEGHIDARVRSTNHLHRYEDNRAFSKMNATERLNAIRSQVEIPVAVISNPSYSEDGAAMPVSVIEYDLEAPQAGSRTGDRFFINVMSFRKPLSVKFGRSARKGDIEVREGYCNRDVTFIRMSEQLFEIESMPKDVSLESKYGTYSMSVRRADGGIEIERSLLMRTGLYDKSEYDGFKAFVEAASAGDAGKIVLKKR